MKKNKLITLLLAVVMVLGLVACGNGGGESTEPADPSTLLVGTWKDEDGTTMKFDSGHGGTCIVSGRPMTCTWQYLPNSNEFQMEWGASAQKVTITEASGEYTLTWKDGDEMVFTKVS